MGMDILRQFEGPSAGMPNVWDPNIKTTEMTKQSIQAIVHEYGRAAMLAKRAGIDGIEIHAIHEGYLLDQFALNCTNKPFIVEMLDDVLKVPGLSAANSNMLRDIIRYYQIPVYLNSKLREVTCEGIVIETQEGKKMLRADDIILSVLFPGPHLQTKMG